MWLCLNDAFLSIVHKDCQRDELLVRARREGDIERIFPQANVTRSTTTDYLFRSVIPRHTVEQAMLGELRRITYSNFKDTVQDEPLHNAYLGVWNRMAMLQKPRPFSARLFKLTGVPEADRLMERDGLSPEEEAHVFATGHMPDEDLPAAPRQRKRRPNDHTAWSPDKRKPKKGKRRSLRKGR